ncbi:MAG: MFS transporter [Proteobacteria bacterium]|nr:MFS transporter [Pseudomonadota bacterium]
MLRLLSPPWRVLAVVIASEAMFFIPVAVTYYGMKGADFGGFLMLQGLYRVAVFVLEVPTGFIADKWHRHTQLMLSRVLWLASLVILYLAQGYTGLLVAELVGALAVTLRSGTIESYLHESLVAQGKGNRTATTSWQGRLFAAGMVTEMAVSPLGGWLFSLHVEAPVLLTIAFAALGMLVSFTLPNIPRKRTARHAHPLADLMAVVHHSLRLHPRLPALLVGPYALFGLTGVLFWFIQERLSQLGVPAGYIGLGMSAYFLLKALLAFNVGGLLQKVGERRLLAAMPLCLATGTLLMLTSQPWLVWVGGMLGAGVVHGLGKPLATSLINHEVEDGERATVLSVASSINTFGGAVLMVAAEPLLNHMGAISMLAGYLALTLMVAGLPLYRLVFHPAAATPGA